MKPFVFQHAQDVWPEGETLFHAYITPRVGLQPPRLTTTRWPIGHGSETDADAVTEALTGDQAAAEWEPRRQGAARQAVPLSVVKKAAAELQSEGENARGSESVLAVRSGYCYLGEDRPAAWVVQKGRLTATLSVTFIA
ncbi:hypothetical protein AB0D14_36245 [Streptomyces sp. NPDC048484]|uniref:hypothetical protein n=1 Tax=Streptomyces sp. NPDC048484 TaxID=3155146 RepID=UPI003435F159